jgi:hypothetical protein
LACNKDSDEIKRDAFTQADAEDWFNTTFKESEEWNKNSDSKSKITDWSNGMYQKKDSLEIFEFPLMENRATITVPQDKSITIRTQRKFWKGQFLDWSLLKQVKIKCLYANYIMFPTINTFYQRDMI